MPGLRSRRLHGECHKVGHLGLEQPFDGSIASTPDVNAQVLVSVSPIDQHEVLLLQLIDKRIDLLLVGRTRQLLTSTKVSRSSLVKVRLSVTRALKQKIEKAALQLDMPVVSSLFF